MKQPLNTRILTRAATVLTCAVCAVGLMTGCSQGSKADSAASASATSGDDYLLKMAKCMRDKGFDVPDTGLTPDQLNDTSDAFNNALNECMMKVSNLTGEGNIANDPAVREAMVKGAECLRGLGYDVKDPQPGEGLNLPDIPEDALNKCFVQAGGAK